ncbi:MAG: tetratricopeptide repeat protein [Lentisphaerota bacterium]
MSPPKPKSKIDPWEILCLNMLLSIAMVVEFFLFYYYYMNVNSLGAYVFAGLIFTMILVLYTWFRSYYQKAEVRDHVISCIFVFFLGRLGCFIAIISNTFDLFYSRKLKVHFSDWLFSYLYAADPNLKESDRIYNRIIAGHEIFADSIDTEPLLDIMGFGSLEQKQAALIKAVKHFRPQLMMPVLHMGLNDPNNVIRVQAAAGLAKIQDNFQRKYTYCERKVIENTESPEELVAFARLCEEYSVSQLLDSERKASVIQQSIKLYERCIILFPDNIDLKISLIRMLIISRKTEQAYNLLSEALPLVKKPSPAIAHALMELLFKMHRFSEMRHFANEWKSVMDKNFGYAINEKIELWSGNQSGMNMEWKLP